MTVDPATSPHRHEYQGHKLLFLRRRLPRPNSPPTREKYLTGAPAATPTRCRRRHHLHLPDASGNPPGRPGLLPDLRHGARAGDAAADADANPELADMTRRFWIGARAGAAGRSSLEMGGHFGSACTRVRRAFRTGVQFALATPVVLWARLAVLRARRAIAAHAQSQHVHADRARHRRRLCLQRRRPLRAGHFPAAFRGSMAAPSRSISRPPP